MPANYLVGGVALERPFKFRRLNHVVIYYTSTFKEISRFYLGLLGLHLTDCQSQGAPYWRGGVAWTKNRPFAFTTLSSIDHHNIGFMPAGSRDGVGHRGAKSTTMMDHFAWDIGSYDETRAFFRYCKTNEIKIRSAGLAMPGSNVLVMYYDPEGNMQHTNWNAEGLGWRYAPKPMALWAAEKVYLRPDEEFEETILPDGELTKRAMEKIEHPRNKKKNNLQAQSVEAYQDLLEEIKNEFAPKQRYNVHGVLLPRPFSLAKLSYLTLS
ncbi:MAG: hypothetical protein ACRDF4_04365, partial [Rhabdochlamydiaceae bacterium]